MRNLQDDSIKDQNYILGFLMEIIRRLYKEQDKLKDFV
jgi:hypothetical protein